MVRGLVTLQRFLTSTTQPGRQSCSEPHMEKRLSDDTKVSNLDTGRVVNAALSDTAITIRFERSEEVPLEHLEANVAGRSFSDQAGSQSRH